MSNVDTLTHNEQSVRTFIRVPSSIWKEAKKAAVDAGMTAERYAIEAIREKVERAQEHAAGDKSKPGRGSRS